MSMDVVLTVSLLGPDKRRRNRFDEAMIERGWWKLPDVPESYQVGFRGMSDDQEIVHECEQDVKAAAQLTGVTRFQATCLISPEQPDGSALESDEDDAGSRLDLGEWGC